MAIGQNQKGTTVNASISVLPTGQFVYTFDDPYNVLVNLSNSTGISIDGGNADDQFNLLNASGDTINGGSGNDTFSISATVGNLNGNIIRGGTGYNLVQTNGSGADVNLDQGYGTGMAASNIEMVVGRIGDTGNTVEVSLNQLATSSLSDANGKAFVDVIGADGVTTVATPGGYQLIGEQDAAGTDYDPTGAVLTGAAAVPISSKVTSVTNVEGDLAVDYSGAYNKQYNPATDDNYLPGALNAYVFSNGTNNYTVWTDGKVVVSPASGPATTPYQPAPVAITGNPVLGTFDQFHQSDPDPSYKYAVGTLGVNPAGLTVLTLYSGNTLAFGAVNLNGVTGTVVHGTGGLKQGSGPNGGNYFGLGPSGGNNIVYGSPVGDLYDLELSNSLIDILRGSTGFDVVRARNPSATPDDVNLTSSNIVTGVASRYIDAVVGSANEPDTVEVDLTTLKVNTSGGTKESEFEALLGGPTSTLTLSAPVGTSWKLVTTFAPGATPPANAEAINDPNGILDTLYAGGPNVAETTLTGYLYEQVNGKGAAVKYVTVYTDATVINSLPAPTTTAALAQAMAQMSTSSSVVAGFHPASLNTASATALAKPIV